MDAASGWIVAKNTTLMLLFPVKLVKLARFFNISVLFHTRLPLCDFISLCDTEERLCVRQNEPESQYRRYCVSSMDEV